MGPIDTIRQKLWLVTESVRLSIETHHCMRKEAHESHNPIHFSHRIVLLGMAPASWTLESLPGPLLLQSFLPLQFTVIRISGFIEQLDVRCGAQVGVIPR